MKREEEERREERVCEGGVKGEEEEGREERSVREG